MSKNPANKHYANWQLQLRVLVLFLPPKAQVLNMKHTQSIHRMFLFPIINNWYYKFKHKMIQVIDPIIDNKDYKATEIK